MENTTQTQTQITVADLDAIRNIMDVATARGAFRANELTAVGIVYDKLTSFLNAVAAQAKADAEAKAAAEAAANGETTTDSESVDASSDTTTDSSQGE